MNESMGSIIMRLRKEHELTQEQLANALGITFQAVSKWENGISSPDISALPLLADLFGVSIDELFGRAPLVPYEAPAREEALAPRAEDAASDLPWPDDNTFYAVLYHGHELIGHLARNQSEREAKQHFAFQYEGPVQNIRSDFSVEIEGDVAGSVYAGTHINCGDVEGNAEAGGNVDCSDVAGHVSAGGNVSCGDVEGNVNAGASVTCEDVDGSVSAGTKVQCDSVVGPVHAFAFSGKTRNAGKTRSEDDYDQDLDEMINRSVEESVRHGTEMGNYGLDLGEKINEAVQRALEIGFRFRNRKGHEQNTSEGPEE